MRVLPAGAACGPPPRSITAGVTFTRSSRRAALRQDLHFECIQRSEALATRAICCRSPARVVPRAPAQRSRSHTCCLIILRVHCVHDAAAGTRRSCAVKYAIGVAAKHEEKTLPQSDAAMETLLTNVQGLAKFVHTVSVRVCALQPVQPGSMRLASLWVACMRPFAFLPCPAPATSRTDVPGLV